MAELPECHGKISYPNPTSAWWAIQQQHPKARAGWSPYQCRQCRDWHLTRSSKPEERAAREYRKQRIEELRDQDVHGYRPRPQWSLGAD